MGDAWPPTLARLRKLVLTQSCAAVRAMCLVHVLCAAAATSRYENMGEETFKDMRRILPISGVTMDWSGHQTKMKATMGTK